MATTAHSTQPKLDRKALKRPDDFKKMFSKVFVALEKHAKKLIAGVLVLVGFGAIGVFYSNHILEDSETEILFVGPENVEAGLAAAQQAGVETVIGWRCEPL